jgi:hypothetical protein
MTHTKNQLSYISTINRNDKQTDVLVTFRISEDGKPKLQTVETMQGEQLAYQEWHKWVARLYIDACLVIDRAVTNLYHEWNCN